MNKIYTLTVFFGIFLLSCSDSAKTIPATDSTNDSAKSKAEPVHQMTVDNPLDRTPHAVKDSIYNGEHVERYDNGVIYMRGDVEGGLRAGQWLTFYKSGKPWSQGIYKDGLRQGYGVSWYENGQKSSEGNYKDDKPVGKWKYWDEYGNMVEKDFGGQ
jgi:antitoxin component YwqK of YwqJK toxin-antitoxin module